MAEKNIIQLQERRLEGVNEEEVREARLEVNVWMEMDELMWKQRSRVSRLKEGDRNSIHTKASNRRQRHKITTLQNDEGAWLEG